MLIEHGGTGTIAGWRTMFWLLALPSVLLGLAALRVLPDTPRHAPWLTRAEAAWLTATTAAEHTPMADPPRRPVLTALRHRRLLAHAAVYAGLCFALYTLQFFLPQMVADAFGSDSVTRVSAAVALCYTLGAACILAVSRRSDRTGERTGHLSLAALTGALALALAPVVASPLLAAATLTVALACVLAAVPVFWALPLALPAGLCASAGVAAVNSLSSVASFLAPYTTGALKDLTGTYGAALLSAAGLLVLSSGSALLLGRTRHPAGT
ncbi:MFS transporter [Streptomyces halobius]|uniref:MFS transporter n=1 Tax=Streptomyces halobius TaxID=2879846 RepID=UPI0024B0E413|nr:MFS transporter [Streptomyces halobius]